MINSVRQTVMSILNKNNYGYISPSDFNLFAKQAQLDLFETYFYSYNYQLQKENARQSGTGYADITKGLEEVIDTFSVTLPLLNAGGNNYFLPSLTTTNNDYYLINKNLVHNNVIVSGTTDGTVGGQNAIVDSTATFTTDGISIGDIVGITIGGITYNYSVTNIVSDTTIQTNGNNINTQPLLYSIYKKGDIKEAEKVTHTKITMLNNSILTKPNLSYPAYTQNGLTVEIYPDTVSNVGQLVSQYIRFPFTPKWTYVTLTNGEPAFDETAVDYQDFELPNDDEVNLVMKILQYAGMSIREIQAVQFAGSEEAQSEQQEK
jgi:hypothetical protein